MYGTKKPLARRRSTSISTITVLPTPCAPSAYSTGMRQALDTKDHANNSETKQTLKMRKVRASPSPSRLDLRNAACKQDSATRRTP